METEAGISSLSTGTFTPTPRQAEFLALDCEEALYGGAAGSGKSEILLAWLAHGIQYPDYAGLIFRRTYPQLAKADGLIPKSFKMYKPLGGHWHGTGSKWTFPSGATIEFGHLHLETSIYDYQGPSFHRIAFDELTQFSEQQYTYLFSRLRRTVGFPLKPGMRAASNPGGEGHMWVKQRFVTKEAMQYTSGLGSDEPSPPGAVFYSTPNRAFVPARLADNPYIDKVDYDAKLMHLDPVTRARLKAGDWTVTEDGRIKVEWLRYWEARGEFYRLLRPDGSLLRVLDPKHCQRICTVDCAGSSEDIAKEKRGKPTSYSVISIWDFDNQNAALILRDQRRGRWEFPDLCFQIKEAYKEHHPDWIGIENEKTGMAALQSLRALPTRPLSHEGKDKLTRAGRLLNEMEQGRVYIDRNAAWRDDLEAEFLAWTGHPDEQADQIDTAAYAARECFRGTGAPTPMRGGLMVGRV